MHSAAAPALADEELVSTAVLVLRAGQDPAASMLALGAYALLEQPDQLAALRADPSLIEGAVEELLRYLSIISFEVSRFALEDIEIAGHVIPEGATVIVGMAAVNRDSRQYSSLSE